MAQQPAIRKREEFLTELAGQLQASSDTERATGIVTAQIPNLGDINQLYGYAAGDDVIAHCAAVLDQVARATDSVVRIGDASFAMVLPGLVSQGQLMLALQKIVRLARAPIKIAENGFLPRVCLGAAFGNDPGADPQSLLLESERALSEAADAGNDFAIYSRDPGTNDRWDIEHALRAALENGDTEVFYQPKVDLQDFRVIGAEALIRWKHESQGWVSPDAFIPIAENCGLIDKLTWSVINSALESFTHWPGAPRQLSIAINISPRVLRGPEFLDSLLQAAALWNAAPEQVVLEVTETAVMAEPEITHGILHEARALGFRIAIDDFGSGYSSLGYFKNLPADQVKIDKQFVLGMTRDSADLHICEAIVDLAHRFGFEVVAEGIEDQATADCLRSLGCDQGQGYHYSRAIPQQAYLEFLSSQA